MKKVAFVKFTFDPNLGLPFRAASYPEILVFTDKMIS